MRILLTGATGFIGSAFARFALSRSHQLAALVIPSEPLPSGWIAPNGPVWLRGTLEDAPWKDIAAFAPDVCVHTAWITTPGVYLESPENFRFRDASLDFLRTAHSRGVGHIVGLGTCIEYQISPAPLSEQTTPIAPATTYARCKNDLRVGLEEQSKESGFALAWCRVFYPYGPGEHPSRLCSSIVHKLSLGERVILKTPNSTKDYIYIEDLAEALLTVVETRFRGAINLATGTGVSVKDIATKLGAIMGRPGLVQEQHPPDADPFPSVVADASRLTNLGWRPAYDLSRGLSALIAAPRRGHRPGA